MNVALEQADNINLDSWALPNLEVQRQGGKVPPRQEWRIETKFRQTCNRTNTSTLFKRFNGHYLAIKTSRRKKERPEQIIDLTFVEPKPREVKDQRYTLWFVATCLLTIPAFVYSLVPFSPLWLGAPVILSLILMVAAVAMRRHHYDFTALNSDVVLFRVDALSAEEDRVKAFVEATCHGIARGQRELPEGRQRLPLAVAEMRRLSEAGVITCAQYESIKRHWFRL